MNFVSKGVLLALVLFFTSFARAGELSDCMDERNEVGVAGCSAIISSGTISGEPISKTDLAIIHFNRGMNYAQMGDSLSALSDFSVAIEINPEYAKAYSNRGLANYRLENFEASILDNTMAILIKPDYDIAYYNRALSYYKLGEYEKSIADNTASLEILPDDDFALFNRALAYEKLGNFERAIEDLRAALIIKPGKNKARDMLERLGG